jgi:hypothetical protein
MSLTKATYSMIDGAPINVLDFGADPTGVSDSTTAIQNAIDAAQTLVKDLGEIVVFTASVYFPSGQYTVNGNVTMRRGVHLIGASKSSVLIRHTGSGQIFATASTGQNQFIWVKELTVEGAGKSTTTAAFNFFGSYFDSGLENVSVTLCGKGAILEDCWTFQINGCHFFNNTDGLEWENATGGQIRNTRFDAADRYGCHILSVSKNTSGLHILNTYFQRSGQHGLRIDALNWSASQIYFENNNQDDGDYADLFIFNDSGNCFDAALFSGTFYADATKTPYPAIRAHNRNILLHGVFVASSGYSESLEGNSNLLSAHVISGQHTMPFNLNASTQIFIDALANPGAAAVRKLYSDENAGIGLYGLPNSNETLSVFTSGARQNISFTGSDNQKCFFNTPANRRNNIVFQSNGVDKFYVGRGDSDDLGDDWFYVDATDNDLTPSFAVNQSGRIKMAELPTSSTGLTSGELWNDAGTIKIV